MKLDNICAACGERLGMHSAANAACPLLDFFQRVDNAGEGRIIGFSPTERFKEIEECE